MMLAINKPIAFGDFTTPDWICEHCGCANNTFKNGRLTPVYRRAIDDEGEELDLCVPCRIKATRKKRGEPDQADLFFDDLDFELREE